LLSLCDVPGLGDVPRSWQQRQVDGGRKRGRGEEKVAESEDSETKKLLFKRAEPRLGST
jgi:hypothetical protein